MVRDGLVDPAVMTAIQEGMVGGDLDLVAVDSSGMLGLNLPLLNSRSPLPDGLTMGLHFSDGLDRDTSPHLDTDDERSIARHALMTLDRHGDGVWSSAGITARAGGDGGGVEGGDGVGGASSDAGGVKTESLPVLSGEGDGLGAVPRGDGSGVGAAASAAAVGGSGGVGGSSSESAVTTTSTTAAGTAVIGSMSSAPGTPSLAPAALSAISTPTVAGVSAVLTPGVSVATPAVTPTTTSAVVRLLPNSKGNSVIQVGDVRIPVPLPRPPAPPAYRTMPPSSHAGACVRVCVGVCYACGVWSLHCMGVCVCVA